ncbi:MAG: amidohydrolase family protein [Bacteroidota bacterium]
MGEERAAGILPIQSAVERTTKEGRVIGEEEKISLLVAIKSLTLYAAWQLNMEDKLGSLEKGKYADFIILDRDPFTTAITELDQIQCTQTYINGNVVRRED